MALQNKIWTPCTIHEVTTVFLQSERHRIAELPQSRDRHILAADYVLIDQPDFHNADDNHRRLRLLYQLRGPLLTEIPPDTAWYQVSNLTPHEFPQLHIIARCGWDDLESKDRNELIPAAKRNPKILKTPPMEWAAPILWGHSKDGPFTIIEGNNRLAAYAILENPPVLDIPVIVGLSLTPFYYHIFDPPNFIADDLWK